jgi:Cdc6-like AAA superfamily ATPase
MAQSRHTILMNAFRPAKEADDPDFFAGRSNEVTQLTDALHVVGSTPLIYGDRGLGKTSLAFQMKYIAMGDNELLDSLKIRGRSISDENQYLTFFVTCTDSTRNFNGLIQLLINAAEEADFTSDEGAKAKYLIGRTTSRKVTLKIFEAESIRRYENAKSRPSYQNLSLTEKLEQLVRIIVDSYYQPVLFIIDELDRLQSTRGLASFIKAASNESLKFLLVGISFNIGSLLADHQSLERSIVPVRLPPMNDDELYEIVEKAEAYLSDEDIALRFDHFATLKIVEYASGFPWFVHVIGQSALLLADDAGREEVVESDVIRAVDTITANRFVQQFSDMYLNIVRNSYQREIVLRTFASWRAPDIPTSEIYRVLKTKLGVSNPSVYKRQLTSREYGRVIHTPPNRNPALVRFANEMFKIYIRLVPSVYTDVDAKVRGAFVP